jgi:hypothetical protein
LLLLGAQVVARRGQAGELTVHLSGTIEAGQHQTGAGREAARIARVGGKPLPHEIDEAMVGARRLDIAQRRRQRLDR